MARHTNIRERAEAAIGGGLLGRERELALLGEITKPDGPSIAYVYGPYGIGKTALLSTFHASVAASGITVAKVRGGSMEPQPAAFEAAVCSSLGLECDSPAQLREALADQDTPVVLIINDADELRLLATWLRQEFAPSLPANVRLVIAGRLPPPAAWTSEFGNLYRAIRLTPLQRDVVISKVVAEGFDFALADRLWSMSIGNPLTLLLLMQAARNGALDKALATGEVVSAIIADAGDPKLASMVEAAAVVRRATLPLMTAMLGPTVVESFDSFGALPFVQFDREGYHIAEPIRRSMAELLASLEPDRYAALREAAARWISNRLNTVGARERWRYMADLLYLVELPQVRDAFFPQDAETPPVEPAEYTDFAEILKITEAAAGASEASVLESWIRFLPDRFSVARDASGSVLAFYVFAREGDRLDEVTAADPLLSLWREHHRSDPKSGEVIFLRQLLAANNRPDAPERAACLLDLKRAYFERWNLSRVYTAASASAIGNPVYRKLGFRLLTEAKGRLAGSMVLELPDSGLIGWVSRLVGVISTPAAAPEFDFIRDRREVTIEGKVCRLTRLEAEVLAMLIDRSPAVVGREEMISTIWKRVHVGSNVVDTVVRSLRRKLGPAGSRVGTVPKSGYRLKGS